MTTDATERLTFNGAPLASTHSIRHEGPAPDFFSGALLGNGALGAVVTTRPDAIVVHFGHNDIWDARVRSDAAGHIGTFSDVLHRIEHLPSSERLLEEDTWYDEYCKTLASDYRAPFPRPHPCGSVIFGFDNRRFEVAEVRLDIGTGTCNVELLEDGCPAVTVALFCERDVDRLWFACLDMSGLPTASPFDRVRLLPDPEGVSDDPLREESLANRHAIWPDTDDVPRDARLHLMDDSRAEPCKTRPGERRRFGFAYSLPDPADVTRLDGGEPGFSLQVATSVALREGQRSDWRGQRRDMGVLHYRPEPGDPFVAFAELSHGRRDEVNSLSDDLDTTAVRWQLAASTAVAWWESFWQRSAIALADPELEGLWYRNSYFLACAVSTRASCPGLFGPWRYRTIGTQWHNDYHFNYNVQQPFWGVFSANRVELHLPYVDLIDTVMPISQKWAREYYELSGAAFPHSAYPVPMKIMPCPNPPWAWQICETPWAVQSLWWHYLFTGDMAFLRDRAIGPITEAVRFIVDYIERPGACPGGLDDGRAHIYPSVVPELYAVTRGLTRNADIISDLTLVRFLLRAWHQAMRILEFEDPALDKRVTSVLDRLVANPTAATPDGDVLISVAGEDPSIVYNDPVAVMPVFPGEEDSFLPGGKDRDIGARTWARQHLEGGNELVFAALQGARLGILDLERWRRQLRYCALPNGTYSDLVLTTGGRYSDGLDFRFMAPMGVWVENFAVTAVIDECLLQSVGQVVRLFPNWPRSVDAAFSTLRARDGFLISAVQRSGTVEVIEVRSEAGHDLAIELPWSSADIERCSPGGTTATEETVGVGIDGLTRLSTNKGEVLRFQRHSE